MALIAVCEWPGARGFRIGVRKDGAGVSVSRAVAASGRFRFLGFARNDMGVGRNDVGVSRNDVGVGRKGFTLWGSQ